MVSSEVVSVLEQEIGPANIKQVFGCELGGELYEETYLYSSEIPATEKIKEAKSVSEYLTGICCTDCFWYAV